MKTGMDFRVRSENRASEHHIFQPDMRSGFGGPSSTHQKFQNSGCFSNSPLFPAKNVIN